MKAIYFDIGGVVVNDHKLRDETGRHFEEVTPERLWQVMNDELLIACQGRQSLADGWRAVASRLEVELPEEVAESLWIDVFRDGVVVNEEVLEIIQQLKPLCHLSVVSNTISKHATILSEMGVYDHFHDVVLSHETGNTKDTPHIFEHALSLRSLEPQDVLFIDDVEKYANVAESLGMRTHIFQTAALLRDELESLGYSL